MAEVLNVNLSAQKNGAKDGASPKKQKVFPNITHKVLIQISPSKDQRNNASIPSDHETNKATISKAQSYMARNEKSHKADKKYDNKSPSSKKNGSTSVPHKMDRIDSDHKVRHSISADKVGKQTRISSMKNVKKRLLFDDVEEDKEEELDFTDKIALLRSLYIAPFKSGWRKENEHGGLHSSDHVRSESLNTEGDNISSVLKNESQEQKHQSVSKIVTDGTEQRLSQISVDLLKVRKNLQEKTWKEIKKESCLDKNVVENKKLENDLNRKNFVTVETQTPKTSRSLVIQSNVPGYEPSPGTRKGDVVSSSTKTIQNSSHRMGSLLRKEGVSGGVHIEANSAFSPKSSLVDSKQTNVQDFVGSVYSPRQNKEKMFYFCDKETITLEDKETMTSVDIVSVTDQDSSIKADGQILKEDAGNRRRKRRSRLVSADMQTHDKIGHDDINLIKMDVKNISEPLVKKAQDSTPKDADALDIKESGPIGVEDLAGPQEPYHSSRSQNMYESCDEVPVKLEKDQSKPPMVGELTVANVKRLLQPGSVIHFHPVSQHMAEENNHMEVEFPVRDMSTFIPGVHGRRDSLLSHNAESCRLSEYSTPWSMRSTESVSSTVEAVKLLRKLYKVKTPEERDDLVLKAKCFRRWLTNVRQMRRHQVLVFESPPPTISYGVSLKKAEIFYRTHTLDQYFGHWKMRASQLKHCKAALALHQHHLLRKGMNAFKWAINRSKLHQAIVQDKVNGILLAVSFRKWRSRAAANRHQRLQAAFTRWRQFTKEAQRIRSLKNQSDQRLKHRIFQKWDKRFKDQLKKNKADKHFKMGLLSFNFSTWKLFTIESKVKKGRQHLAKKMFEKNLTRNMFTQITVMFEKYQRAKKFHRQHQLKQALVAWQQGSKECQGENLENQRVAEEHWYRVILKSHFYGWQDRLLNKRACRMSDKIFIKHAFAEWKVKYEKRIQRRGEIDSFVRQKVMRRAFFRWKFTVNTLKKCRAAAIQCLETALLRHVLYRWEMYTAYKIELRKRFKIHERKQQLLVQKHCLAEWRARFQEQLDEQKARQIWSNTCARKAAAKWKLICHKQRLKHLLEETETLRLINRQKVMFKKWSTALRLVKEEKAEANRYRKELELILLRKRFTQWWEATQPLLKIKPMILRQQQELLASSFYGWHELVKQKAHCKQSLDLFHSTTLRRKFNCWRRQYLIHQVEKGVSKQVLQNCARRYIEGWRFVIKRKHSAVKFHENHVLKTVFSHWRHRSIHQLHQKMLKHQELEEKTYLLQTYFGMWYENVQCQIHETDGVIIKLQQLHNTSRLRCAFQFWRCHFRATLLARENNRLQTRRLTKQILMEWKRVTEFAMMEAVKKLAIAIGLQIPEPATSSVRCNSGSGNFGESSQNLFLDGEEMEEGLEPLNLNLDGLPSVQPSQLTTPRHASSYGTPLRSLLYPLSRGQISLQQSLDLGSASQLNSDFLDARFEMEQAVKTERMREIVTNVVTRLRHWPVSILFDQWKEFTIRQRELKNFAKVMSERHQSLTLSMIFKTWVRHYKSMKLAREHRNVILQKQVLAFLYSYSCDRRQKKKLSTLANKHCAIKVYSKVFPMWFNKAKEKHHREHIVHLWSNLTPEEKALMPRESALHQRLNQRTLRICFALWCLHYEQLTKLKKAYHKIIMEKYFTAWSSWAREKHDKKAKSQEFCDRRVKTLVFKTWCFRHMQKTEVASRYGEVWHNYTGLILMSWRTLAAENRRLKQQSARVKECHNNNLVSQMFHNWCSATQTQIRVKKWYQRWLLLRVLYAWLSVAEWQKDMQKNVITFQVRSYTRLVERCFHTWRSCHIKRLNAHKEHEKMVQQRVIEIGHYWRKRAQNTRGHLLQQRMQKQHVRQLFDRLKAAFARNMEREDQLQNYLAQKNYQVLRQYLDKWRYVLMENHTKHVFSAKLLATFIQEWHLAAKACKERQLNLRVFEQARQEMTLKTYFAYWFNLVQVIRSTKQNSNLRIQLHVFRAWLSYTRRTSRLRHLQWTFTKRVNMSIVKSTWYTMKTRSQYCQELTAMAENIHKEKNEKLMQHVLTRWRKQLNLVLAGEFYQKLLAIRTCKRWYRFVLRQKQERRRDQEQLDKAIQHCNKKLCRQVFSAWHNEILVKHQIQRRSQQLERKYAQHWKWKVDLAHTAACVEVEVLLKRCWQIWHMAYIKSKTVKQVEVYESRQLLSQVFNAWRNLSIKKPLKRASQIPLPMIPSSSLKAPGWGSSSPIYDKSSTEIHTPTISGHSFQTALPVPSLRGPQIAVSARRNIRPSNLPIGSNVPGRRT
ncbi:hypothetical protein CHS0354_027231 [Potamilus streckersoni]|uniref:Sfi1 spindle body domain-containing protein n=1 Tax=Potamilus streckersoni TaxID=2493646 RepID=A0AAE0RQR9_9BIVA|nr:hypothetical protein CHS0354_027231 [Potamilus streckersoni]